MRKGTALPFLLGGLISPAPPSVAPLGRLKLAPPLTRFGSGSPVEPAGAGMPLPRRAPPLSSTALTLRENMCCCPVLGAAVDDDEGAAAFGPGVVHRGGIAVTGPPTLMLLIDMA
jgi:hypothetical protein